MASVFVREPDHEHQLFHGARDVNGQWFVMMGDFAGPLVCVSSEYDTEEELMQTVDTMNELTEQSMHKRVARALFNAVRDN